MRGRAPTVEGFGVSGFVSRGTFVDAGEAPQPLVVVLQLVVGSAISTLVRARCSRAGSVPTARKYHWSKYHGSKYHRSRSKKP